MARREAYIRLVFQVTTCFGDRRVFCGTFFLQGEHALPLGHFIEDTFSQRAMLLMREDYDRWFPEFGTFVFQPWRQGGETALICHLDGRNYREDGQRRERGWGDNPVLQVREQGEGEEQGQGGGQEKGVAVSFEREDQEIDYQELTGGLFDV